MVAATTLLVQDLPHLPPHQQAQHLKYTILATAKHDYLDMRLRVLLFYCFYRILGPAAHLVEIPTAWSL